MNSRNSNGRNGTLKSGISKIDNAKEASICSLEFDADSGAQGRPFRDVVCSGRRKKKEVLE